MTTVKKNIGRQLRRLTGYFVEEAALAHSGVKLDLGCGPVPLPGHQGVDRIKLPGVDFVVDLERDPLPFADGSVDLVYSSNVLEHVANLEWVMAEVWRVLRQDGRFLVQVPYAGCRKTFQDPTHVRFFTLNSFEYFVSDQTVAPKWYFEVLFQRVARKKYVFTRTLLNFVLAPIVNSSGKMQQWYENSIFFISAPVAIEVELVK